MTAAACGDRGGLRAAGPTPTAVSPAKLWPDLRPASSPAYPYAVSTRVVVKGVKVPGDDIRKVDPVDVVEAEIKATPDDYGSKGAYHATVDRLEDCRPGGDKARCPLLKPNYRDLTGDGRDDMTLGFRLYPTNQTAVRVYTVEKHHLVQVLADNDAILGVELAGRTLIERSPADISGYEYRTTWEWDPGQRAMVFSRDEYLHTGDGRKATKPSASASPSATPSASSR
ncbi:lipoprotein [Streptomyces sp. MMG1121]|nr:lipoprotein [Streptomyces sp. MMG1121]